MSIEMVEVYGFLIPEDYVWPPTSHKARHCMKALKEYENEFLAVSPFMPLGVFIICETMNDAKGCRNLLRHAGVICKDIIELKIERKYYDEAKEKKNGRKQEEEQSSGNDTDRAD